MNTPSVPRFSFISANYVARQLGHHMPGGWMQGDAAANAHYRPLETFPERFAALLDHVRGLGFTAIDLWTAHLNPEWATPTHLEVAARLLHERGLTVPSLAGGFGDTPEAFARACAVARAVGARVLGGGAGAYVTHRAEVLALLRENDLRLALENHPEKTPEELLARIGPDTGGQVGAAVDTGWFATQGCPVPEALRALRAHLFHVHLKDVRAPGGAPTGFPMADMGHATCALGDGVADIAGCVAVLREIGYKGPVGLEHEPEDRDPDPELVLGLARARAWFAATKAVCASA
jgi:sugar phosphate isomerase/epimerase